MGLWSQIVGFLVTHVISADMFWLLGKSWVEYRVMDMELTLEVGRANFRLKRNSLMVMVGSRTPNKQQRSYAGSRRCAAGGSVRMPGGSVLAWCWA